MIRRLLLGTLGPILALLLLAPAAFAESPPAGVPTPPSATLNDGADRVSFGSDITIGPNDSVRDAICVGCSITVESGGLVSRDMVVIGGHGDVRGQVGRDAIVVGGTLQLGPKASVGRDAVSIGGGSEIASGATVGRDHTSIGAPGVTLGAGFSHNSGPNAGSLVPGIVLVVLAVLILLLFPAQLETTAALLEARPGASFGLGCLGIVAAVMLAVLLGITVILLPVSLVITLGVGAAWLFGWAAIYLVLGRRLLTAVDHRARPLVAVVVGGAAVALLALVPLAGVLTGLLGGSMALGAALGSRFGTRREQTDFFSWRSPAPVPAGWPPPPPSPAAPAPPGEDPKPLDKPPEGNT